MLPISSRLVPHGAESVINEANSVRSALDRRVGSDFVRVEAGGSRVGLTLMGARPVEGRADGATMRYDAVEPGVSPEYESRSDGLKETVVLHNADAPASYRFRLSRPAGAELRPQRRRDVSWTLVHADGRSTFVLGAPGSHLHHRYESATVMSTEVVMRQPEDSEIRRPLLPIAEASPRIRDIVEHSGIVFRADDDPGIPGPSDSAVIELPSGTQFAFEHHHGHPDDFVVVRAERGSGKPADRLAELVRAAALDPADIKRIEDAWDVA